VFFARGANCQTLATLTRQYERGLARLIAMIPYETLPRLKEVPAGVYVFTDLETLTPAQLALARAAADQLEDAGARVLSHPVRALTRLPLLERLSHGGRNRFRAFRSTAIPPDLQFPVFLRLERDHEGPRTPLIETPEDLEQVILEGYAKGYDPFDLLVVEFLDTSDSAGIFRKYGAFRIGERIVARHLIGGRTWMLKAADRLKTAELLAEEHEYMNANPHQDRLRPLFELAGIAYGRIDYAMLGEDIQTWEINTNPVAMSPTHHYDETQLPHHQAVAARLREAFEGLDAGSLQKDVPIHLRLRDVQLT